MRAPDGRLTPKEIKWLTEHPDCCEELINATIEAWDRANEPQDEDVDPEYEMWLEEQIDQNRAAIARATNTPTLTEVRQSYIESLICGSGPSPKNNAFLREIYAEHPEVVRPTTKEFLRSYLAQHPELLPFAVSVSALKRKRPRERQENDCRNLEPYMRELMAETHRYVCAVRAACWRLLGKRKPPPPLTAIGIACRYKGVDEDQYLNWCKNRAKYRRNKRRIARPS
jgi:hypothetical protein